LVAKRLAETPLTPRLIPEAHLPHDAGDWTNAHIWLHKPPMALWCMAASIKVFGAKPWAVRVPSILRSALAVGLLAHFAIQIDPKMRRYFFAGRPDTYRDEEVVA